MLRLVKVINILVLLWIMISIIAAQLWARYSAIKDCYFHPERCEIYTYGYSIRDIYINLEFLDIFILFAFYLPVFLLTSLYVIFKKEEYNRKFWFFFIIFVLVMALISLNHLGLHPVVVFRL